LNVERNKRKAKGICQMGRKFGLIVPTEIKKKILFDI
jgi:hypothetical protein